MNSRSGKELFYLSALGVWLRVPVQASGATWNTGTPTTLLEGRYLTDIGVDGPRNYDVSPDGRRFLMIKPGNDAGPRPRSSSCKHWDEELKRLVATSR
jgi:hypothetical protein